MTVPMAEKITIYCHGDEEICAQVTKEFEGKPLTIEVQRIIAVEEIGGRVRVHLASGETREEGFLVSRSNTMPLHAQVALFLQSD